MFMYFNTVPISLLLYNHFFLCLLSPSSPSHSLQKKKKNSSFMALTLLSHELSDLCIGKPPLRCLSVATATVADAIAALKSSDEPFLTVWSCNHDEKTDDNDKCECLGKICMADVICYLSKFDNNVLSLSSAFDASVSVLLPKSRALVVHVQSSCRYVTNPDIGSVS